MARQKTRADGLVEIKRRINGRDRHFYGRTKREAENKYKQALIDAANVSEHGENFQTVAQAFWAWKEPRIKYGSRRGYRHKVDTAVAWFGSVGMRDVTATDVSRELARMAAAGSAYKTVAGQKSVLSMIWRYWCENMDGDTNPVDLVKLPQGLPQRQRRAPTDEEVDLIRQNPQGFGLCPAFMLYAGLRLGEVMGLQKKDVSAGQIKISKAVVWHGNVPEIETPKTANAVRTIPLLALLQDAIGDRLDTLQPDDYIFGGAYPMTKSAYENAWLQYCASLGLVHDTGKKEKTGRLDKNGKPLYKTIMAADFTAHQLRHEFAGVLVRCGISVQVAKDIMGHADILTTQRWYAEAKAQDVDAAAEKLNLYYGRNKVVND